MKVGGWVSGAIAVLALATGEAENSNVLRVSRAFFEKPLQVQIQLTPQQGESENFQAPVEWIEYPPAEAPPSSGAQNGQVLADFRDFVACAEAPSLGQAKLCFNVMADVSNLGLNDREMRLEGIETISADTSLCGSSRYLLKKAERTERRLSLEFVPASGSACGTKVQLTLTQLS